MAHPGLAHRGFLTDEALQGVLPQRGDDLDGHFLLHHLIEDGDLVEQAHGVIFSLDLDDLGGADHPLQIADAALIAVLGLLRTLIFKILAEVAKGTGGLHLLD